MAKTYNKLNIEINQKVTDIITAVQDDTNSRYLDVQLFDNGTPINLTGQEVRIFLKKPDGTNIWNGGEVTSATEGRCQFLLTTQTLAVCGVLETQISIWQNNEEILSTEIFKIFVTKSLRSSGSIESSNEYGSLVILFQNIYEALDLMTEMVQSFGTAGAVAQGIPATTFWQMLEAVYTVNADALANASVSEVLNRMGLTNDSGATATTGTLMGKVNELIKRPISAYTVQSETLQEYVEESQTQYSGTYSYNGTQNHYHTIGLYYPKFNGTIKVKIEGNIINFPSRPFYVGIYYNSPNSSKFYATNTSITEFYAKGTYEAVTSGSDSVPAMKIQVSSPMPTGIFSTSFVITVQQGVPVSFIAVAGTANGDSYTFNINKIELCYDIKTAGVI